MHSQEMLLHSRKALRPDPCDWGKSCLPSSSIPFVPQEGLEPSGSKWPKPHEPLGEELNGSSWNVWQIAPNILTTSMSFGLKGPSEGLCAKKVHEDAVHCCFMTPAVHNRGSRQKHLDAPYRITMQPRTVFQIGSSHNAVGCGSTARDRKTVTGDISRKTGVQ